MNSRFLYATGAALTISLILTLPSFAAMAKPTSVKYKGKTYYRVISTDKNQNTGNKVCALVGKACVGYTGYTNDICKAFHPQAKKGTGVNGSKAGFYCDGTPQSGVCRILKNTCEICPACNVNASCTTDISDQYREMYVECGADLQKTQSSSSSNKSSSSSSSSKLSPINLPKGTVGPFPGKIACDFYQKSKKVVTCKAYKAADTFCVVAMQNRLAKAVECNDNGRIVCTSPCPTGKQKALDRCAYDPGRLSGYQVKPYNFCK